LCAPLKENYPCYVGDGKKRKKKPYEELDKKEADTEWDDDGVRDHDEGGGPHEIHDEGGDPHEIHDEEVDPHDIAIRPMHRDMSERENSKKKLRRASLSSADRQENLRNLTEREDKKQPFAFGMLAKFTLLVNEMAGFELLPSNVMFERFGVYLTDIKWDAILVCDPPSFKTVTSYQFLTVDVKVNKEDAKKSKKGEQLEMISSRQLETLPFMPKNGQKGIQKALHILLNNLFFGGAYTTLCREVKKPKVRHVVLLRDRTRPRCSASRTIDTSLLFKYTQRRRTPK